MIIVKSLRKVYQSNGKAVEALKGIDLEISKGEIFGIIGFSGAGKSSLVRCLNLLEKPTEGSIIIGEQEMTKLSAQELRKARTKIGMIFQHFNLLYNRTVFGNVAFPLEIAKVPRIEIEKRVTQLLSLVGLEDKAQVYPAQLSGGQKQRVGIARALANDPQVLLCDEATSALDPQTTKSILGLLKDINNQLKITIVLITHEMGVMKEICDRVAVIEDGIIIEQGTMMEIFTQPKTQTAQGFVGSIFNSNIPAEIKNQQLILGGGKTKKKLVRIIFVGEWAGQPVISNLVKKYQVDANILSGNIEHLKDQPFGTLLVEIAGDNEDTEHAIEYLQSLGLGIEVMENVS